MNTYNIKTTIFLLTVSLAIMPALSFSKSSSEKHFGKNAPFAVTDLPVSKARTKLERLTSERRKTALQKLHKVSGSWGEMCDAH